MPTANQVQMGQHLLGGVPSRQGTDTFQALDPTTGETLGVEFVEATMEEIQRAMSLASEAHVVWKRLPRERRAHLLEAIAEEIEALGDELLEEAHRETALPMVRLMGERGRTTAQLRLFADVVREGSFLEPRIDRAQPARQPLPKPDLRSLRLPVGPVVVFGASNFPLAFSVAGGDTASALAAGCPVVVKAHPSHPRTSEQVASAIAKALRTLDLPAGTFSLVHGRSPEVGAALVEHPETRAVGFTGSLGAGRALFDLAAARPRPIPVFAEMGSTNPVVLLPQALEKRGEEIAQGLAGSVSQGVGQFCTNPGLLLALRGEATETFLQLLASHLDQTAPGTMLHRGIRAQYDAGLERFRNTTGVRQVSVGASGEELAETRASLCQTDASTFLAHSMLAEEVFGPVTLLVTCSDEEELLHVARSLEGQLTATVHAEAEDLSLVGDLLSILEEKAGRLLFGGYPTGVEICPAMHHGGPYPATTDAGSTSVGTAAVKRFTRPVCYQDLPQELLPVELHDTNPDRILRQVDGSWTREDLS